jgi:hypothetical protein
MAIKLKPTNIRAHFDKLTEKAEGVESYSKFYDSIPKDAASLEKMLAQLFVILAHEEYLAKKPKSKLVKLR